MDRITGLEGGDTSIGSKTGTGHLDLSVSKHDPCIHFEICDCFPGSSPRISADGR
jgi:hypothetical protein